MEYKCHLVQGQKPRSGGRTQSVQGLECLSQLTEGTCVLQTPHAHKQTVMEAEWVGQPLPSFLSLEEEENGVREQAWCHW